VNAELACNGHGATTGPLRVRDDSDDHVAEASRLPYFGIAAPSEPTRARVKNHVRRRPAQALDGDLAKAIDDSMFDTTRCAPHDGASADIVVDVTVEKGAVAKARTSAPSNDALTRCLLEVACDVPVPLKAGAMHATIPLRVRSMKDAADAPKLAVLSRGGSVPASTFTAPADANESGGNDVAILGGVLREAAMACEQGQLLGTQPRHVVMALSASPHSTVPPTVNVARGQMSEPAPSASLLHCMGARMDGFRLPLSPSHGVGQTVFRVTWDG
jgi:hypothetical protein